MPLIAHHGLLSATELCQLFEVDKDRAQSPTTANRHIHQTLKHPRYGEAILRRQIMPDASLARRLAPGLTPAEWRGFINGHVFLWPTKAAAETLLDAERHRDQAVIAWPTAALLEYGLVLLGCRFNNGAIDRASPSKRRLRAFTDYRAIESFHPAEVREVLIKGGIPPGLAVLPL